MFRTFCFWMPVDDPDFSGDQVRHDSHIYDAFLHCDTVFQGSGTSSQDSLIPALLFVLDLVLVLVLESQRKTEDEDEYENEDD